MIDFITGIASWVWVFVSSNPIQVLIAYAIVGIAWASFRWITNLVKLRSFVIENMETWKNTARQKLEAAKSNPRTEPEDPDKFYDKELESIRDLKVSRFLYDNDFDGRDVTYPLRVSQFKSRLSWTAALWPYYVVHFIFADVAKLVWSSFGGIFNKISSAILPEVK